jgi:hypothetical protein
MLWTSRLGERRLTPLHFGAAGGDVLNPCGYLTSAVEACDEV